MAKFWAETDGGNPCPPDSSPPDTLPAGTHAPAGFGSGTEQAPAAGGAADWNAHPEPPDTGAPPQVAPRVLVDFAAPAADSQRRFDSARPTLESAPSPTDNLTRTTIRPSSSRIPTSLAACSMPSAQPPPELHTRTAKRGQRLLSPRMVLALIAAFLVPFLGATWLGSSLDVGDRREIAVSTPAQTAAHSPESEGAAVHSPSLAAPALTPVTVPTPVTAHPPPAIGARAAVVSERPRTPRFNASTSPSAVKPPPSSPIVPAQAPNARSATASSRDTMPRTIKTPPSFRVGLPKAGPRQRSDHKVEITD